MSRQWKWVIPLLVAACTAFGLAGEASDEDLRREVEELKQRLARLEALLESGTRIPARHSEEETPAAAPAETAPAEEAEPADPSRFEARWNNGLRLETRDERFEFQVGGRLQNDWAFFSADDSLERLAPIQDGTEFRRARVLLAATLFRQIEMKAEYDFAGGDAAFKDVYLGLTDLPGVGSIRFGHQKEPFSLEELTSSKYITFLERALPNTFAPSRNSGVVMQNTLARERVNWALGVFRDANDNAFAVGEGGYNFSTRFTGLPWYRDEDRLLHLGIAYSRQNSPLDLLRYRQRPEAHLAPRIVNTGFFPSSSQDLLGLEAALVSGPFSVQSEYAGAFVNTPSGSDPRFSSFYVQASYFPTGEHRVYKKSAASFDRVKPKGSFFDGGRGAWELAARYSHLDLDDADVSGGRLDDFTFGVNWYLNPNTRFMWNYVYSERERVGDAHVLQTRFHIDF